MGAVAYVRLSMHGIHNRKGIASREPSNAHGCRKKRARAAKVKTRQGTCGKTAMDARAYTVRRVY